MDIVPRKEKKRNAFEKLLLLRGPDLNRGLKVMQFHFDFRRLRRYVRVRDLDYAFTLMGCLPSSLYTFPDVRRDLARRCHLTEFTEFGRYPRNIATPRAQ